MFTETLLSSLDLHQGIKATLANQNMEFASDVQAASIPAAMQGKDLLVSAQTGSGKTAAFLIPAIHHLLTVEEQEGSGTRVLILSPTRELARQLFKQAKLLTANTQLNCGLIIGGDEFKFQKAIFRKNPEIVIATPGRLVEHLEKGSPDFKLLEMLILDEADKMLEFGFNDDMLFITKFCNEQRQTMLFSATLNHKNMGGLAKALLNEPEKIILNAEREISANIEHRMILSDDKDLKQKQLAWLLENEEYNKAVIFTNTRVQADQLGGLMRYKGLKAQSLHGELSQDDRKRVMEQLRENKFNVLIASDVAARGLDIDGIDLVINFDFPRSGDDYTHRVGRTGRAGNEGIAISFILPTEWNLKASIERYLSVNLTKQAIEPLKAKFTGPKKLKKSGKAAGKKKKPASKSPYKKPAAKGKAKPKNKTKAKPAVQRDAGGFSPLKKKPKE